LILWVSKIVTGTLKRKNISIVSLPSAHIDTDSISKADASNYLFLIQADGFRRAHTGDYGQTALSAEQKTAMAAGVDLCLMQLENILSNMTFKNLRAFELIKEMNPGLVIISHFKEAIFEYTIKNYRVWSGDEKPIRITKNDIPSQTEFILLGKTAPAFSSIYQLKEWHK
jgi:hypothetical protein